MIHFSKLLTVLTATLVFGYFTEIHADIIGTQPGGSGSTDVISIQPTPFLVTPIGPAGGGERLSGLDYADINDPSSTLFASSGYSNPNPTNQGSLFTVNPNTGAATLVGSTGFLAVPAIAFDLDGTLFGSAASNDDDGSDTLITINPATGAGATVGLFGTLGIDGLAIDPISGILYGGGGNGDGGGGESTNFDNLFTINKTTGLATLLGTLSEAGSGDALPSDLVGLTFDGKGGMFGSLGFGDGSIVSIDLNNLEFTILGDATPIANGASISGIAAEPVPEPATIALLGIGIFGLAGAEVRRRRKKKAVDKS